MSYQRIQPFPAASTYEFPELRALSSVWRERKTALEEDGAYKEFIKKLQREWAIETGIIERLYTWDRGVTEVLIEQGIESSIIAHRGGVSQRDAEHIQALINDHLGIVEGLFGVKAAAKIGGTDVAMIALEMIPDEHRRQQVRERLAAHVVVDVDVGVRQRGLGRRSAGAARTARKRRARAGRPVRAPRNRVRGAPRRFRRRPPRSPGRREGR